MHPDLPGTPVRPWAAWVTLAAVLVAFAALPTGHAAGEVALGYVFYAGLAVWAWHLCQRDGVRLRDLVGRPPADRRKWAWVALAVPLLAFGYTALVGGYYALSFAAPGFVERNVLAPDEPSPLGGRPLLVALDAAETVVFAPAAEELFFRGGLLHRWGARWGFRRGVIASSALFGALHADPLGGVAFGVCMALLYRRTGTLLVPMACHALLNGLIMVLDALAPAEPAGETLGEFRAWAWWAALALPAAAAALAVAGGRLRAARTTGTPRPAA